MVVTVQKREVQFVSRTGRVVTLRPCTPADAPLIADMYRHLSPQTLYLRFCSAGVKVSGELEAQRLCGGHPEAQGVVLALSQGEVIGIGEFVRMDDETAEIAFLVRDDCQGEGIGTALAEQLVEVARETGFSKLQAYMLWENYGMRRLLAKLPFPRSSDGGWGGLCVTLEIGCAPLALR